MRLETPAILDVAFALLYPRVTRISQRAAPCQEVPCFFEGPARQPPLWQGQGCWLARLSALENPNPHLEAYLAPGEHMIRVTVGCEKGKESSREFTLKSPALWRDLAIVEGDTAGSPSSPP